MCKTRKQITLEFPSVTPRIGRLIQNEGNSRIGGVKLENGKI